MWSFLNLMVGVIVGGILAPTFGFCDGSMQNMIKGRIEQLSFSIPNIPTIVTPAVAQEQSDGKSYRLGWDSSPFIPSVGEKHISSISHPTGMGFGVIEPCEEGGKVGGTGYTCQYTGNGSSLLGSQASDLAWNLAYSETEAAVNGVAWSIIKTNCFDMSIVTNVDPAKFVNPEYYNEAADFSDEVISTLSTLPDFGKISEFNKLHDKLLGIQGFIGAPSTSEAEGTRIAHPAGDIFMLEFQIGVLHIAGDTEVQEVLCSNLN